MITDEMVENALGAYEGVLFTLHANAFHEAEPVSVSEIRSKALRAALTAALGDASWQDISTAPKDGRGILVCQDGMEEPWTVRWRNGKRKQGWQTSFSFIHFEPTFWQPLPTPPVTRHERGATTGGGE